MSVEGQPVVPDLGVLQVTVEAACRAKPQARIVLLLPTETYRASAFLAAAAALDAEVVVATEQSPPLATEMEDRLVDVDFDQPEVSAARIAALAERVPVAAVVGWMSRAYSLRPMRASCWAWRTILLTPWRQPATRSRCVACSPPGVSLSLGFG